MRTSPFHLILQYLFDYKNDKNDSEHWQIENEKGKKLVVANWLWVTEIKDRQGQMRQHQILHPNLPSRCQRAQVS